MESESLDRYELQWPLLLPGRSESAHSRRCGQILGESKTICNILQVYEEVSGWKPPHENQRRMLNLGPIALHAQVMRETQDPLHHTHRSTIVVWLDFNAHK